LKHLDDERFENRKGKIKLWSGPLPPPRRSLLHTLTDCIAKEKFVHRPPVGNRGNIGDHMQVHCSLKLSSTWQRRLSTRGGDHGDEPIQLGEVSRSVPITANSKPNVGVLMEPGRHELIMGHEGESIRSTLGYMPTPGLISLFARIGIRHSNPKHPSLLLQRSRCSYADIVCSNMEQGAHRRTMDARVMVRVASSLGNRVEQGKRKLFVGVSTDPILVMVVDHMVGEVELTVSCSMVGVTAPSLCCTEEDLRGSGDHKLIFFHRNSNMAQDWGCLKSLRRRFCSNNRRHIFLVLAPWCKHRRLREQPRWHQRPNPTSLTSVGCRCQQWVC
jgi:hypothetical protein